MVKKATGAEAQRLEEDRQREQHWKRWGPYLSERSVGYRAGRLQRRSARHGNICPHESARSQSVSMEEDGLAGICDGISTFVWRWRSGTGRIRF